MQHTRIKILVLMTIFLTSGRCFSQNQQVLRNGYVAATNQGIYYLQDGTDEWLNFNIDGEWVSVFFYRDLDTITSLTYNGRDLFCTGYFLDYTGIYLNVSNIKINGNNNYENYGDPTSADGHPYQFRPIFGTNKFKTKNIQYIAKPTWVYDYSCALRNNNDGYIATSKSELSTEITGICSDNDSIVVVVGPNNKLAKITCSNNFTNMTVSWVTGLAANVLSNHKVCHSKLTDHFYIINDENIVRGYNKTSLSSNWDLYNLTSELIFDIDCFESSTWDIVGLGYSSQSGGYITLFYGNSETIILTTDVLDAEYGAIAINNKNIDDPSKPTYVAIGVKNNFRIYNPEAGSLVKTLNLPSGVIIYDLEYINYLE